jgi:two-component system chemotaxis response regulator CheY
MKKILLVEDSLSLRKIATLMFKKHGHEVTGEAWTKDQACKLYKEGNPDIVFLDIMLPGESGIDILKELIEIDKDAVIVMATALNQEEINKEVTEIGAKGIIHKPYKTAKLIQIMNDVLV